jgi:hypothetical protein
VEISCLLDAASEETLRLYQIGVDDTAAEEAFEDAMNQLRMVTIAPRPSRGCGRRPQRSSISNGTQTSSSLKRPSKERPSACLSPACSTARFRIVCPTGPRPGSESTKIGPPALNWHRRSDLGINCP